MPAFARPVFLDIVATDLSECQRRTIASLPAYERRNPCPPLDTCPTLAGRKDASGHTKLLHQREGATLGSGCSHLPAKEVGNKCLDCGATQALAPSPPLTAARDTWCNFKVILSGLDTGCCGVIRCSKFVSIIDGVGVVLSGHLREGVCLDRRLYNGLGWDKSLILKD